MLVPLRLKLACLSFHDKIVVIVEYGWARVLSGVTLELHLGAETTCV